MPLLLLWRARRTTNNGAAEANNSDTINDERVAAFFFIRANWFCCYFLSFFSQEQEKKRVKQKPQRDEHSLCVVWYWAKLVTSVQFNILWTFCLSQILFSWIKSVAFIGSLTSYLFRVCRRFGEKRTKSNFPTTDRCLYRRGIAHTVRKSLYTRDIFTYYS